MLFFWQKTIHKSSFSLMSPKSTDVFRVDFMLVSSTDTHNKLPKIPQVEDVVNFSRSREQFFQAVIIDLD